ncbi:MAG: acyl-ACP--UDP-N-acetylglucosamine O-acyltransferase [Thermodesulfovibrio sp.]|uniref:Acyl-[acyl-carrier-protein]--UDP-N-acetylglucosamine O-acyltransferase n=2 Tax=Thermodesulfovibrio TaxID=28261 RepID=A0A2J6WPP3_9BACT|nr:MAG: acyl-[acyl-carrier-protein]--UDP-N-acetylglucosamine O-acyltransferase [Thermodesulfovibrio aggregans]
MSQIHKTAIVSSKAEIDEDVVIGPYCIIGDNVRIGKGTRLINHVQIEGITEIGENCTIFPFTSIGFPPQDIKYKGQPTGVKIGSNNTIREYVTIHRASVSGDGWTVIGDNNFIMAYVHIAHDCKIGNSVIMANLATLAGHVQVEDFAFIGGLVAVHQFTRIGAHAMIGGFSGVGQDVPPFTMASGPRAKLYGLNSVGLKRRGFSDETINILKKAYKILFRDKLQLKEAIEKVKKELPQIPEIIHLIEFIEANKRGICR